MLPNNTSLSAAAVCNLWNGVSPAIWPGGFESPESGASGGANVALGDRILKWNAATQTYDGLAVLIDGVGDPTYDGKWLDELNFPNESAMLITPGLGYFFVDRVPRGFAWNYPR